MWTNRPATNGTEPPIVGERAALASALAWLPWTIAMMIPVAAYAFGAVARESTLLAILLGVAYWLTSLVPVASTVLAVAALAVAMFGNVSPLVALVLSIAALGPLVESMTHRMHSGNLAEQLKAFLNGQGLEFEEIKHHKDVSAWFSSYGVKATAMKRIRALIPQGIAAHSWLDGPQVRVFKMRHKDGSFSMSARAFAFQRFPSLVFLRHDFDAVNAAAKFQALHELAHGTMLGTAVFLRRYRWIASTRVAAVLFVPWLGSIGYVLLAGVVDPAEALWAIAVPTAMVVVFASAGRNMTPVTWLRTHLFESGGVAAALVSVGVPLGVASYLGSISLGAVAGTACLGAGLWLRQRVHHLAIAGHEGAGEVTADSVALSHPIYRPTEWMTIASLRLRLLESEAEASAGSGVDDNAIALRMGWLRRHLSLGKVVPYVPVDNIPTMVPSLVLLGAAGYLIGMPGPVGFALAVLALAVVVYGFHEMASNAATTHAQFVEIDTILGSLIRAKGS